MLVDNYNDNYSTSDRSSRIQHWLKTGLPKLCEEQAAVHFGPAAKSVLNRIIKNGFK